MNHGKEKFMCDIYFYIFPFLVIVQITKYNHIKKWLYLGFHLLTFPIVYFI